MDAETLTLIRLAAALMCLAAVFALRARARSWVEARRRHPVQFANASAVVIALGVGGLVGPADPLGVARGLAIAAAAFALGGLALAARASIRERRG